WCCDMLAQDDAEDLPALIVDRLYELFELPDVVLRLWDKQGPAPFVQEVGEALRGYTNSLAAPYCGSTQDSPAAEWLNPSAQSMACIALRPEGGINAFGVLVLGSEDVGRFTSDMATDFLAVIGKLASSALH